MTATRIELRGNAKRGGGQPKEWLKTLYTFAVPPYVLTGDRWSYGCPDSITRLRIQGIPCRWPRIIRAVTNHQRGPSRGWQRVWVSLPPGIRDLLLLGSGGAQTVSDNNESNRVFATRCASQDSMDNVEILKRGDIQLTSAGTGIRHNEVCNGNEDVHFVQIWTLPWKKSLKPEYFTR